MHCLFWQKMNPLGRSRGHRQISGCRCQSVITSWEQRITWNTKAHELRKFSFHTSYKEARNAAKT